MSQRFRRRVLGDESFGGHRRGFAGLGHRKRHPSNREGSGSRPARVLRDAVAHHPEAGTTFRARYGQPTGSFDTAVQPHSAGAKASTLWLAASAGAHAASDDRVTVHPALPRSPTNTSDAAFVSSDTRLLARDSNATNRPSALIVVCWLRPLLCVPLAPTLTRVVALVWRSCTNTSSRCCSYRLRRGWWRKDSNPTQRPSALTTGIAELPLVGPPRRHATLTRDVVARLPVVHEHVLPASSCRRGRDCWPLTVNATQRPSALIADAPS